MPEENDENLSIQDIVVLSAFATATIVAVGALAKLGYDLADEGIRMIKNKRNQKKQ